MTDLELFQLETTLGDLVHVRKYLSKEVKKMESGYFFFLFFSLSKGRGCHTAAFFPICSLHMLLKANAQQEC